MSYDIELLDPVTKEVIEFETPHQINGGTYVIGGTREAWLNITYNYSRWYHTLGTFPEYEDGLDGIRAIYGMSGAESIPVLKNAIKVLEESKENLTTEEIKDYESQGVSGYWIPTKENAIKPLHQLLAFAQMRPDGIWRGD